jgi:putative chitinase
MISAQQLHKIMPSATPARIANFIGPLNATMEEFGINTPKRQAAFLAQLAHESGSLRYVQEIASGAAYDNRADLGNTRRMRLRWRRLAGTTPGRYYKGRGLIQITGYNNYRACSRDLLHDADELCKHPEMLEMLPLSVRSAAWYWDSRDLNALADAGKFDLITKAINGGYNGMADRQAYHARAQKALASSEDAAGPAPFPNKKPNLFQRIAQWFRS